MLVTVVHNPGAGYAKAAEDELLDELRRAGYEPVYVSLREAGWRSALAGPVEFVVAAGGDGTVKRVALELAGRDVPVAVVPMGTANNIARTLGVSGSVREQIAWWGRRRIRLLDLGRVSGAGRSDRFLESFGLGAFARAIERLKSREDEAKERFDDAREQASPGRRGVRGDRRAAADAALADGGGRPGLLRRLRPRRADERARDRAGPPLAPGADPGDGWLDVVRIGEAQRSAFLGFLAALSEEERSPPDFPSARARVFEIDGELPEAHLDDELWPPESSRGATPFPVRITVEPGAVRFL